MIEKVRIGFSPLSQSLYLYRHGKDPALALEKREANADVLTAVVNYMMYDAPKGASQKVNIGDKRGKWYEITVKPTARPTKREAQEKP